MSELAGSPDIILVWPRGRSAPAATHVSGFHVRTLPSSEDADWIDLHRCAVPSFGREDLETWLAWVATEPEGWPTRDEYLAHTR